MITQDELGSLAGAEVDDNAGERIGRVGQIFVHPETGEPQWVTVRTGELSFQESYVPLRGARFADGRLTVAFGRELVRQVPLVPTDGPLEVPDAERLEAHYRLNTDDAMTRSEERLVAGTVREPVTKVRLRKYLVTEQRQVTVPVTREEVRLEEVPVTAPEPAEDTTDVVLHAEQPVVTTETVPVERVRLTKQTVRDEQTVTAPVRREEIEYEGPS